METSEEGQQRKTRGDSLQRQKSQRKETPSRAKEDKREGEDIDDMIARKIAAKKSGRSSSRRQSRQGPDNSHAEKGKHRWAI